MSLESVARRIAAKGYFAELATSRALGCGGVAAYISAFRAMDETYLRAFSPGRAAVWPRARTVTGKGPG